MYGDEIVSTELTASVELVITETEPGMQGDRVSGATKPATLETGLTIQVPLFLEIGEAVKVDTRTEVTLVEHEHSLLRKEEQMGSTATNELPEGTPEYIAKRREGRETILNLLYEAELNR